MHDQDVFALFIKEIEIISISKLKQNQVYQQIIEVHLQKKIKILKEQNYFAYKLIQINIDFNHFKFLEDSKLNQVIVENKIQLKQIIKGMIAFSLNACSEYLLMLLTMEKIQQLIDKLHLYQIQSYYQTSYQSPYLNIHNLPPEEYLEDIKIQLKN
ncbi:unnamed protein product [Paramecium sonneborni]|uniref:Uncharacterized protein n=1 Tax=Paramecium sonneborni TaxID=65129 RepID=A0A8S1RSW5_9CILI|nr:unnamed protein product [Paramecium sonneborni]